MKSGCFFFSFLEPNFAAPREKCCTETHSIQSLQWGACIRKEGSFEAAAGEEAAVTFAYMRHHYAVPLRQSSPCWTSCGGTQRSANQTEGLSGFAAKQVCTWYALLSHKSGAVLHSASLVQGQPQEWHRILDDFSHDRPELFFVFFYLHHKRVRAETTTEVVGPQKRPTLWHSTKAPVCHRHFHRRFVFQENNLTGRWVHRPQRCASLLRERMSVWITAANRRTKDGHTPADYQVFREQYAIFCLLDSTNKFCSVQH